MLSRSKCTALALVAAGISLTTAGVFLLYVSLVCGEAMRIAYDERNGANVPRSDIDRAIVQLDGVARFSVISAEGVAALAFLHYAAAGRARQTNTALWLSELSATRQAARQALRLSPTRADVSLVLAEAEYLLDPSQRNFEAPLLLSLVTAPRELWIATRRIGLELRVFQDVSPEVEVGIEADIRLLGEPYQSLDNYEVLARAASNGGPAAIALVQEILARGHPWPFRFFNEDLERLNRQQSAS